MSSPSGTEANNPENPLAQIPLEELSFIAASLFIVGSGISLYVAYQNLKNPSSNVPVSEEVTL